MDVQKQIDYWRTGSDEDLDAAALLVEKGRFRHGLFFAHLAVEKMLKAHVARTTRKIPPKIHNLVRLAEIAQLALSSEKLDLLREFGIYLLEGRYPDSSQLPLTNETVRRDLARAGEMLTWLKSQL